MDAILSYDHKPGDDYYCILGCTDISSRDQILAEFKARALEVHPDKNPDDPNAEERFKLLQMAKDCLINPEARRRYDTWRTSGIAMPFESWMALGKNVQTSMHWVTRRQNKAAMLEATPDPNKEFYVNTSRSHIPTSTSNEQGGDEMMKCRRPGKQRPLWERDDNPNAALQRFRNYEI